MATLLLSCLKRTKAYACLDVTMQLRWYAWFSWNAEAANLRITLMQMALNLSTPIIECKWKTAHAFTKKKSSMLIPYSRYCSAILILFTSISSCTKLHVAPDSLHRNHLPLSRWNLRPWTTIADFSYHSLYRHGFSRVGGKITVGFTRVFAPLQHSNQIIL